MSLHLRPESVVLLGAVLALALGSTVQAQPVPSTDTFDLVLVGDSLAAFTHRVALTSNPIGGATWAMLDEAQCEEMERLLVLPAQPTDRYLGQDIRETTWCCG